MISLLSLAGLYVSYRCQRPQQDFLLIRTNVWTLGISAGIVRSKNESSSSLKGHFVLG